MQVLTSALLRYQTSRGGAETLSVRRVQLFGYVSLVDSSGFDRGRVHATTFWQSRKRFPHGKFNTIRVRIGNELEFARLLLVFGATLSKASGEDFPPEQLVLVRKLDREEVGQAASGQAWRETRLKWPSNDHGYYVLPMRDIVDAWHLVPDVNHARNSGHYIANDFIFSLVSTEGNRVVAGSDTTANSATLNSAAQTHHEEQAIGPFEPPVSGTYARWVAVAEPPSAAQFERGLHLSKPPRNVIAHRSDAAGWNIGLLRGRVKKAPKCARDKPIAGMYKVKYPDRRHLETHALLPTNYGVDARWVLLKKPGTVR